MTPIGRLLKATRAIRVYKDGDGHGFVWRWWNPVAWGFLARVIIGARLMKGNPQNKKKSDDL